MIPSLDSFLDELEKISLEKEAILGELFNPAYRREMYDLGHRGVEAMGAHAVNDAVMHGISKLPTAIANPLMHSPHAAQELAMSTAAFGPVRGGLYHAGLKASQKGLRKGIQLAESKAPRLAKAMGVAAMPIGVQEAAWSNLPAAWDGGVSLPGLFG